MPQKNKYPVTPDGRYFVVRGRLWRTSNPHLAPQDRDGLVAELMSARRAVRDAKRADDHQMADAAHEAVDRIKRALGERGPVWWSDGARDYNRHLAKNSPYAEWFAELTTQRGTPESGER